MPAITPATPCSHFLVPPATGSHCAGQWSPKIRWSSSSSTAGAVPGSVEVVGRIRGGSWSWTMGLMQSGSTGVRGANIGCSTAAASTSAASRTSRRHGSTTPCGRCPYTSATSEISVGIGSRTTLTRNCAVSPISRRECSMAATTSGSRLVRPQPNRADLLWASLRRRSGGCAPRISPSPWESTKSGPFRSLSRSTEGSEWAQSMRIGRRTPSWPSCSACTPAPLLRYLLRLTLGDAAARRGPAAGDHGPHLAPSGALRR